MIKFGLNWPVILLFVFTSKTFSQVNCQKTPSYYVNLNKDSNGSLKGASIQDQDGLGTCYANTTSLLLEAWGGEPVSYHQIAINYGLDWKIPLLNEDAISRGQFLSEMGWVCGAIQSIKDNGNKVCKRKDSPLEYLLEDDKQEVLLKGLGSFYDSFQDQNSTDQKKIIEIIKKSVEKASQEKFVQCDNQSGLLKEAEKSIVDLTKKVGLEVFQVFTEININMNSMNDSFELKKEKIEFCSNLMSRLGNFSFSTGNGSEMLFSPNQATKEKISLFLSEIYRGSLKIETKEDRKKVYNKIFQNLLTLKDAKEMKYPLNECINLNLISDYLLADESNTKKFLYPIQRFSDPNFCLFSSQINFIKKGINANKSCVKFDEGFNDIQEVLESIEPSFSEHHLFTKNLIQLLQEPQKKIDDFFKSLLERTCMSKALTIPEDLQCHWHLLPERMNPIQKAFTSSKDVEKFEREKTKSKMNGIISSQLESVFSDTQKRGKPVEISVCKNFLTNSSHKASWNPETNSIYDCKLFPSANTHSMAVTGMRCHLGQIQYQIQNSWGKDCSYLDDKHKRNCDPDTGLFWINEDVLAENIYELTVLSRSKNNKSFKEK
jgi:hypothetical protein